MSLKEWFGKLWFGAKRNSPRILTATGISLMLYGTVSAAKAAPEAMERIEQKKKEEGTDKLTFLQVLQATYKCYVWTAVAEMTGAGCLIASLKENEKRNGALLLAANSGLQGLREFAEYRKFVAQQIGEKKEHDIYNQAAQEMVNQNPPPAPVVNANPNFIEGKAPKPACCHLQYRRYFYADYDDVVKAVNKLNARINNSLEGYVSLNDFYWEIGVESTEYGDQVGWSQETGLIEIPERENIRYTGTPDGWPCWILEFTNPPQYEYKFFRNR